MEVYMEIFVYYNQRKHVIFCNSLSDDCQGGLGNQRRIYLPSGNGRCIVNPDYG